MLKSKHYADNSEFLDIWYNIEKFVSYKEASRLIDKAVSKIKDVVSTKRAAYGWSGGKDSLALQVVCEKAGIFRGVCAIASNLSFPDVLKWIPEHIPHGVSLIDYPRYDIRFLKEHPELLFPYPSKNKWAKLVQIDAQEKYAKQHSIEVMLLGRRTKDGNNCTTYHKKGVTIYNPIHEWSHEEVLAVIHYFWGRDILPTYFYRDGFVLSAEIWPNLIKTPNKQEGWQRIFEINPSIVQKASQYIQSAKEFLTSKQ